MLRYHDKLPLLTLQLLPFHQTLSVRSTFRFQTRSCGRPTSPQVCTCLSCTTPMDAIFAISFTRRKQCLDFLIELIKAFGQDAKMRCLAIILPNHSNRVLDPIAHLANRKWFFPGFSAFSGAHKASGRIVKAVALFRRAPIFASHRRSFRERHLKARKKVKERDFELPTCTCHLEDKGQSHHSEAKHGPTPCPAVTHAATTCAHWKTNVHYVGRAFLCKRLSTNL
jgi:hypothetical protein